MTHESDLDSTIKNSIGCIGLIQLCPINGVQTKTVNGKTYTLEELRYNLEAQFDVIEDFWVKGYKAGKITKPSDLYIYNFFPVAAGKPDSFVIQYKGLSATNVANSNLVFNRTLGKPKGTALTVGDLIKYYKLTNMSKIDKLKEQHPELNVSIIDLLSKIDPSDTNKYVEFLIKQIKNSYDYDGDNTNLSLYIMTEIVGDVNVETLNEF